MYGIYIEHDFRSKTMLLVLQIGMSISITSETILNSYRFSIGVAENKIELHGVKGPSHKVRDALLVKAIGWEEKMCLYYTQCACPNGGTPVIENVSSLKIHCQP
jgi:hypothetical protein